MRASADGVERVDALPVEPGSMMEVYPKAAAAAATAIVPAMTPVKAMLVIRLSFPEFEIELSAHVQAAGRTVRVEWCKDVAGFRFVCR